MSAYTHYFVRIEDEYGNAQLNPRLFDEWAARCEHYNQQNGYPTGSRYNFNNMMFQNQDYFGDMYITKDTNGALMSYAFVQNNQIVDAKEYLARIVDIYHAHNAPFDEAARDLVDKIAKIDAHGDSVRLMDEREVFEFINRDYFSHNMLGEPYWDYGNVIYPEGDWLAVEGNSRFNTLQGYFPPDSLEHSDPYEAVNAFVNSGCVHTLVDGGTVTVTISELYRMTPEQRALVQELAKDVAKEEKVQLRLQILTQNKEIYELLNDNDKDYYYPDLEDNGRDQKNIDDWILK